MKAALGDEGTSEALETYKGLLFPELGTYMEDRISKALKIMEEEAKKGPQFVKSMQLKPPGRREKGVGRAR